MKHSTTQSITTSRLLLRPFVIEDADAMYRNWASDPEVTAYLTWPIHQDINVTKGILTSWIAQYPNAGYYNWAITLADEPIGNISVVKVFESQNRLEIGYCLSRQQWHHGYMSEALQAVINYLFTNTDCQQISSCHDPLNPHSGMVMRHCRMRYEGTWRCGGVNNQGICDLSYYSISRQEYQQDLFTTSRRPLQELSQTEVEHILQQANNGILSIRAKNGYPYGIPLNFGYMDNKLYFHCALTSQIITGIKENGLSCFTVVDQAINQPEKLSTAYRSVMAFGWCRLVEQPQEKLVALTALAEKYGPKDEAFITAEVNKSLNSTALICLTISHLTGQRSK